MSLSGTRLHGQAVKTQPSHGCNRGSNPLGVTKKTRTLLRPCFFVIRIPVLRLVSRPATGCTLARLALAVRRIPLESPSTNNYERFHVRIFLYTPVLRLVSRPATGRTLARLALAVRRIPLESPKKLISDAPKRPFFYPPVLRLVSRPATGCTLARLALAVRRIPSKPVKNFGRFSAPDLSCLFRASSLRLSLRIASCKARHRRRPRRAALHACPAPRRRRP